MQIYSIVGVLYIFQRRNEAFVQLVAFVIFQTCCLSFSRLLKSRNGAEIFWSWCHREPVYLFLRAHCVQQPWLLYSLTEFQFLWCFTFTHFQNHCTICTCKICSSWEKFNHLSPGMQIELQHFIDCWYHLLSCNYCICWFPLGYWLDRRGEKKKT